MNLHSRDIRKASGAFKVLQDPRRRREFAGELSAMMDTLPYDLFIVGIHKQRLRDRYVNARNPYDLALTYVMERLVHCLERRGQTALPIVAESRGHNEDNALKAAFFDLTNNGTRYVAKDRFEATAFRLLFHDKLRNIAGIQMADLCAYPSARHMLKPEQPNRAFEIVKRHLYRSGGKNLGWKVFP